MAVPTAQDNEVRISVKLLTLNNNEYIVLKTMFANAGFKKLVSTFNLESINYNGTNSSVWS